MQFWMLFLSPYTKYRTFSRSIKFLSMKKTMMRMIQPETRRPLKRTRTIKHHRQYSRPHLNLYLREVIVREHIKLVVIRMNKIHSTTNFQLILNFFRNFSFLHWPCSSYSCSSSSLSSSELSLGLQCSCSWASGKDFWLTGRENSTNLAFGFEKLKRRSVWLLGGGSGGFVCVGVLFLDCESWD